MVITSLKTSAEISAESNPWWVYHPTLSNYVELLSSPSYLTYFRNSAVVSIVVVTITETDTDSVASGGSGVLKLATLAAPGDAATHPQRGPIHRSPEIVLRIPTSASPAPEAPEAARDAPRPAPRPAPR